MPCHLVTLFFDGIRLCALTTRRKDRKESQAEPSQAKPRQDKTSQDTTEEKERTSERTKKIFTRIVKTLFVKNYTEKGKRGKQKKERFVFFPKDIKYIFWGLMMSFGVCTSVSEWL